MTIKMAAVGIRGTRLMADKPKKHIPVSITSDGKSDIKIRLKLPSSRPVIIVSLFPEPIIHSHITDGLPENHPRAYPTETDGIFCEACRKMVHAVNNECMQTWIEWGEHICCGKCFGYILSYGGGVLNEKVFDDLNAAIDAANLVAKKL